MNGFVLSAKDRASLQALLTDYRNGVLNADLPPAPADDDITAPEVYAGMTPSGGIPSGMTGTGSVFGTGSALDAMGSASCKVYREFDGSLYPQDFEIEAFNFTANDIPGFTPVLLLRDKFGTWYAINPEGTGTGGGSSNCNNSLAALQTSDCLTATGSAGASGSVALKYNGSRWVSTDSITYPGGSGLVEFWYVAGEPLHLGVYYTAPSVASVLLELISCGDGCWQGGPLTGHVANSGTACAGETFKVCVACSECPTVTVACCPNPLSTTLHVTVTGFTGFSFPYVGCASINGTYPVDLTNHTATGVDGTWSYPYRFYDVSGADADLLLSTSSISCVNSQNGKTYYGVWVLECVDNGPYQGWLLSLWMFPLGDKTGISTPVYDMGQDGWDGCDPLALLLNVGKGGTPDGKFSATVTE